MDPEATPRFTRRSVVIVASRQSTNVLELAHAPLSSPEHLENREPGGIGQRVEKCHGAVELGRNVRRVVTTGWYIKKYWSVRRNGKCAGAASPNVLRLMTSGDAGDEDRVSGGR